MLIIRKSNETIITNPKDIYESYTDRVVAVNSSDTIGGIPENITKRLPSEKAVHLTLGWIYNQIFNQRNNHNIVIDIDACPFLHVKEEEEDDGIFIDELRP